MRLIVAIALGLLGCFLALSLQLGDGFSYVIGQNFGIATMFYLQASES